MDQSVIEVLGKITALEFILSVMLANHCAQMPEGDAVLARFAEDIDRAIRFRTTMPPGHASPDAVMAIQTAAIAAAEQFFRRTADKFVEIA
jgi:hypothetical protein